MKSGCLITGKADDSNTTSGIGDVSSEFRCFYRLERVLRIWAVMSPVNSIGSPRLLVTTRRSCTPSPQYSLRSSVSGRSEMGESAISPWKPTREDAPRLLVPRPGVGDGLPM